MAAFSRDKIIVEGMTFFGYHGTLEAENDLGQPFVVSVTMNADLRPAGESDDLTKSVDYSKVHDAAKRIVEGERVALIETVAERIASAVLEDHPSVEAVTVRVKKPHVRLGGTVLEGSAVEILRER
ncbi:folB: dihydroneopterin aldolase [Rubrobacter radiotolerans]|uniref:7,8-dihydroneopterin aldolase n=1 Tax=Rubrobacter radiotolerans TaxID=42256 RepID=A0A023X5B4_RUBRA|nr:dihydroneopterin aldolase [Rubrobacter radiotolerans]AHY47406.1 folB: dihydroneopterin aldolase [Rubrobacter radiotolerans]MDX5894809.1 dihydroneopterin aldolase [Rubrobacter radiotolerans]SMC06808.1 dihydroneopterin aldolase [Rubrobacter radiotolerans DSM 5868]